MTPIAALARDDGRLAAHAPSSRAKREARSRGICTQLTNQLTNSPTHQLTNSPTHQLTNSPTHQRHSPLQHVTQPLPRRADPTDVEVAELGVLRADLVEPHVRDDLLERQRIAREQRHAPFPR